MNRVTVILCTALAVLFTSCEEPATIPTFPIMFTATSDMAPLRGVTIVADGSGLGETGADGRLHVTLPGYDGQAVAIAAQCPEGYRSPDSLPLLMLRQFRSVGAQPTERSIEVSIDCPPTERSVAIVIRAVEGDGKGLAGLPVMMRGREVARTDGHGAAHLLMRLRPNSSFRLNFDTAGHPELRPQNPGRLFVVADADQVVLFDRHFGKQRRRRRRRRRPTAMFMQMPMRIP